MDWATFAELGTAAGTLILALATFASVRSANRAAQAAERSLREELRPLLLTTRLHDDGEKVGFGDDHWVKVPGGHAIADVTDEAIYLAMSLRNVGTGVAVLRSWLLRPERLLGEVTVPDPTTFRALTRDLYIAPNDSGFWQGAFRDPNAPEFSDARKVIESRDPFTVDLLYNDNEGGQRMITRLAVLPVHDDEWLSSVSHHWNLDNPDPR